MVGVAWMLRLVGEVNYTLMKQFNAELYPVLMILLSCAVSVIPMVYLKVYSVKYTISYSIKYKVYSIK